VRDLLKPVGDAQRPVVRTKKAEPRAGNNT
jgi:hypothetical protein